MPKQHVVHGRVAKKARQEAALVRQEERNKRTYKQQVQRLRAAGHGHCKEVSRLNKLANDLAASGGLPIEIL